MSSGTINILCATDNNYAPYCGIMLTSLFESNRKQRFAVYIMIDGSLSRKNFKKLNKLGEKYGQLLRMITVTLDSVKDFPVHNTSHKITLPTYYRLLAADVLPQELHKVVYLDCDVIVNGDISTLWNTDLDGYAVAGVTDCFFYYNDYTYQRLDYSSDLGYFNAGVLLINLDYCRHHSLSSRFREFLDKAMPEQLQMMDQDVLNGVLCGKIKYILERFNLQTEFFMKKLWNGYPKDFQDALVEESKNAVVIHYCGSLKPWQFQYDGGVYQTNWNYYYQKSFWKSCKSRKPWTKYVKRSVERLLCKKAYYRKITSIWVSDFL